MRFAAIADIHGNCLALEAVLADIRTQGIDAIVNLGDMVSGPLDARRTMDVVKALDAIHVLGNHDRYLIDRPLEKMGSWERDVYSQLDASDLDWLRAVPPTRCFEIVSFCATRRLRAMRPTGWKPRCPTATSRCRRWTPSRKPRMESRSR
jgi:3',5'-cyclic AMP phosphodiesterase CpdA